MDIPRIKGLDLFSGIGGNTLALRDYIKTVAYCEYDKHAQSVLLSRMADGSIEHAPIWDDIKTLRGDMFDIPIDILFGGFPCQDISVAGTGAGLDGKRSGLFFEIVRLAKEIKPTFLFLENVPAVRTRGLDRVIQELTKIGYDCRWCMLSAYEVGAPHKRERWFLLAHSNSNSNQRTVSRIDAKQNSLSSVSREEIDTTRMSSGASGSQSGEASTGHETNVADSVGAWVKPYLGGVVDGISTDVVKSHPRYLDATFWEKEPKDIQRVTEEKEQRAERLKRLGNAVVPLQAKTAFEHLIGIYV